MDGKLSEKLEDEILRICKRDGGEKGLFIADMLAISENELEDNVWDYLKKNSDTTFEKLSVYIHTVLCPPLEIVDDEWDEDEDNG